MKTKGNAAFVPRVLHGTGRATAEYLLAVGAVVVLADKIASLASALASANTSHFTGKTICPDGGRGVQNCGVPVKDQ